MKKNNILEVFATLDKTNIYLLVTKCVFQEILDYDRKKNIYILDYGYTSLGFKLLTTDMMCFINILDSIK